MQTDTKPIRGRSLTRRELQVLQLMAEGAPSKEIARQLNLSIHTVNAHLHGTYIKLRARNRLEAARWYWEQFGMQQPGQLAHLALGGDPPARAT